MYYPYVFSTLSSLELENMIVAYIAVNYKELGSLLTGVAFNTYFMKILVLLELLLVKSVSQNGGQDLFKNVPIFCSGI